MSVKSASSDSRIADLAEVVLEVAKALILEKQ